MNSYLSQSGEHAIVLGGSLAGLLAARVLSGHFSQVTIFEKDSVKNQPESRKGQPQTRHLHGLLPSGLNIMCHYFSGLLEEIVSHGGIVVDFADSMNWHAYGGFKKRFVLGVDGVSISRPLLEHLIRERVLDLPNVRLFDQSKVKQLSTSADKKRVTGVITENELSGQQSHTAELVIDCAGRGSRTPRWLNEMGYDQPSVTDVRINVGYTTRTYQRDPDDPRGRTWMAYTPEAPLDKRIGAIFAIEGNRWMVTVGGWHKEHAPLDEKGYREFVKTLPNPNIYDIVSHCQPMSELIPYKFPASTRRHYEKVRSFPEGLLVLGDAISSFNPIYGQGMTSACLQAVELDKVLGKGFRGNMLASVYFRRISTIIDTIWQLATAEDFRFPETTGKRPFGIDLINRYVARVHRATIKDETVCRAFLKVMALLRPPKTLLYPGIMWRVLKAS